MYLVVIHQIDDWISIKFSTIYGYAHAGNFHALNSRLNKDDMYKQKKVLVFKKMFLFKDYSEKSIFTELKANWRL